ncbi:hypothetical protein E4U03_01980 [Rothia nasimurium]|uniref:Uncharacterized protein n=1 Tax=Rothia nasimurium TaxID=85336 RepID=A0A4Y9F7N7_9MICC|nr:hypothetical protein [Rothia nasimurium]MBF0807381.1 hypothetical protein [Rothia nasimurium]TFU23891.1 hypothetical protein E4U03_01980 [Rothia nasimurium]
MSLPPRRIYWGNDEEQIFALSEGYNFVAEHVEPGTFELAGEFSNQVHALVARHETIESGSLPTFAPQCDLSSILMETAVKLLSFT